MPEAYRSAVERALARNRIDAPAGLADLTGTSGALLGPSDDNPGVKLLAPIGIVVESDRPRFRWTRLKGASFQVSVYDERYVEIARSDWLGSSKWQAPKPLKWRERYSWQLKVRRSGSDFTVPAPPAPEARFGVLKRAAAQELARLRTQWGDSHLLLGVAYGRVGLLEEAERELKGLREQNLDSPVVEGILSSIDGLRHGSGRSGLKQ